MRLNRVIQVIGLMVLSACDDDGPTGERWLEDLQDDFYTGKHPECIAYCQATLDCYQWTNEECFEGCDYAFENKPACSEEALAFISCDTILRGYSCGAGFSECGDVGLAFSLCTMGPYGGTDTEQGLCGFYEYKNKQVHETLCEEVIGPDGTQLGAECTCTNDEQSVTCTQPTISCEKGDSCCATALP